jgi:hypothetical protein
MEEPMTDHLDTLLKASDPYAASPASRDVITEASVAVATAVVAEDRSLQGRARAARRRRRIALATAFAAVAVPATAWAGYTFAAQSGLFGAPHQTENDTSEWIKVCAADFPEYFATLPQPKDAPPEGLTWTEIGHRIVAQKQTANAQDCASSGVMEQRTGLIGSYYMWAENTWECRAVRDHAAGNDAGFRKNAANAATMMTRLDGLGLYGDENWKTYREALLKGDFAKINEFSSANSAGMAACA